MRFSREFSLRRAQRCVVLRLRSKVYPILLVPTNEATLRHSLVFTLENATSSSMREMMRYALRNASISHFSLRRSHTAAFFARRGSLAGFNSIKSDAYESMVGAHERPSAAIVSKLTLFCKLSLYV